MRLKELITNISSCEQELDSVINCIHEYHYHPDKWMDHGVAEDEIPFVLENYRRVIATLNEIEPTETQMKLVVSRVSDSVYTDSNGREIVEPPYWDVFGQLPDFEYASSLAFTPWSEWLGMELDNPEMPIDYFKYAYVAHILWEMTFYGFNEVKIQAKLMDITSDMDQVMSEEESFGGFV